VSIDRDQEELGPEKPSTLEAGARIRRYLILERVGNGAMGVVYGAYDPELDRKIALKFLDGDPGEQNEVGRARLLREAKVMARLTHPNVVAVHDVGVFGGRVFLAMEFLAGGTLRKWLTARRRDCREVLTVFAAAGKGLAAAHAAGLVHRDFKPENVLLDNDGRPRVVDFGLAREAASLDEQREAGDPLPDPVEQELFNQATWVSGADPPNHSLRTLTRTGTIMGTPAYMAPEQFLGEATDARSDQFSFCVALYEALYGVRPFEGGTVLRFLHDVDGARFQPPPEDREVPGWIRRAVVRGLGASRAQRWPSMEALIAALEDDPPARHRRRLLFALGSALLVAVLAIATHAVWQRRQAWERQIAVHLEEAVQSSSLGQAKAAELRELRRRAFGAFDAPDRARGESLWSKALAMVPTVEAAYDRAERAYEAALGLDPSRGEVRSKLVDVLYQHLTLAEELRRNDRLRALATRLEQYDEGGVGRAALEAPGVLSLHTRPQATTVILERYEREPESGRRHPVPAPWSGTTGGPASVTAGSYRFTVRAPERAEVIFPFEIRRDERLDIDLPLPAAAAIPHGFVYVPAGEFWFGDADEQLRTGFLGSVPIHRRRTAAYLIARHEVTYGEWIAFLDSLPPSERAQYAPNVSTPLHGALRLREIDGRWQFTFEPTSRRYSAWSGEMISYQGRRIRAEQNWSRLPVGGISPSDADRYLAWLRTSGGVPGARLCSELEWERAARGADDRLYPHGDELHADDANFDQTYGRVDSAFGPDEVGSHPTSRSPFGIDDLAGNVFELVTSSDRSEEIAVRGGAYYFSSYTCRITNREVVTSGLHDVTMGLRVCVSVEEGADALQ
jgi:formylglycine-generating enzyme required for sulfatase activity